MKHGKFEKNPPIAPRKKLLAVVLSLALLLSLGVGVTLAYFAHASGPVINTFRSGSVGAEIEEGITGNTKNSIKVKNTGDSPVYVRVRLVSYWMDGDNIAPAASESVSVRLGTNWKQIGSYYYYTKPLAGDTETENLLGAGITMTNKDGYKQVIEVLADTVQASPVNAVREAWGVEASAITG